MAPYDVASVIHLTLIDHITNPRFLSHMASQDVVTVTRLTLLYHIVYLILLFQIASHDVLDPNPPRFEPSFIESNGIP
jgi:hypothetical protein